MYNTNTTKSNTTNTKNSTNMYIKYKKFNKYVQQIQKIQQICTSNTKNTSNNEFLGEWKNIFLWFSNLSSHGVTYFRMTIDPKTIETLSLLILSYSNKYVHSMCTPTFSDDEASLSNSSLLHHINNFPNLKLKIKVFISKTLQIRNQSIFVMIFLWRQSPKY